MMRDLIAPQREREKLGSRIQAQHQKMGMSGFFAPKSANLNVRDITCGESGAGFIAEYEGQQPPSQVTPEPVAQGTYAYYEAIAREMGESKGISSLATASQVPAGLQQASGKALQVFEDFEDVRLIAYHRERERFRVRLAWLVVHAAKRIVERKGSYETTYRAKHGIKKVDWKKLLEDAKDFVIRVFPVSALSKNPAAKFAQLTELLNAGAITVEQFRRLFEIPDLEAENDLDMADYNIIAKALDTMVINGTYVTPMPTDNFDMAIGLASKFVNLCRLQEVPEDRIKLVIDYIEDVKGLKDQAQPPPPPAAAPMPGMPPMTPDGGGAPPPMPPEMVAAMPPIAA